MSLVTAKLSEKGEIGFLKFPLQLLIMRLFYNPRHTGDRKQAWKCFLIGSLITSSFIFLATTESVVVFLCTLALIAAGLILFIDTNMSYRKAVFLFQNIVSAGAGFIVSVLFYLWGFLLLYFGIIVILVMVTWLQKFIVSGKSGDERKKEREEKKQ
jgi:hypothetical protein